MLKHRKANAGKSLCRKNVHNTRMTIHDTRVTCPECLLCLDMLMETNEYYKNLNILITGEEDAEIRSGGCDNSDKEVVS